MAYKIEEIEGVGPAYAQKLAGAHIATTDDLLQHCCAPAGRKRIAEATGISESLLLKWSNHADLMRVSGIGPQFAELLEAAGVDTIKELRTRNAENLAVKMREANDAKKLAKTAPSASVIEKWIQQSSGMEPRITH